MSLTLNVEDLHIVRRDVVGTSSRIAGLESEKDHGQLSLPASHNLQRHKMEEYALLATIPKPTESFESVS